MADKLIEVNGAFNKRWKDMGDGTFAEVVAVGGTAATGGLTNTELRATAVPVSDAVVGVTTGAAVSTDANGTLQGYLRGLVKLVVAKIGVTIADGDMATLGATTGAAVSTDAAGTLQQYLRGLVKLLVDKVTIKIDQTTPGTTNKVVTDPVAATPTPYNLTLTLADTEYSQALPANCRGFEFQARTEATLRFAFVTGKVATSVSPFRTLKAGDYYYSPPINQGASPSTIYVASSTAGTVCELLAWV
jgi:hypothetical protein